MALVVTARAHAETPAPRTILAAAPLSRILVVAAPSLVAITLIAESAARALPGTGWLDTLATAATGCAGVLVMTVCLGAWFMRREDGALLLAATLAPMLLALRTVGNALLIALDLLTFANVLSVSAGLLVLGTSVWSAAAWRWTPQPSRAWTGEAAQAELFRRVAEVTAFVLFAVGLSGAAVGAVGASWACGGAFPDCNGLGALPFGRDPAADVQLYHRLLAYVGFGLVLWLAIEARRTQRRLAHVPKAALLLLGATTLDGVVGAVSVSVGVPPVAEVAHTTASALTTSAAVVLVVLSHRANVVFVPEAARSHTAKLLMAYVQLTKPRVMSLLLATTATAMVIAARGMPDLGILVATLVGGALMSGGAGAINHYVDRDIDPLMGRTAWRPIPSGVISPGNALRFGIALAIIASVVLLLFVNPLAMLLAQIGLLGYVFIYTLWLKRSTPSNIVIGGAAGAIPPLVGWAAVTNEVSSLTAWYLFAIIFFWTPPHFWALSLLIRQHYERAGVPMLPVVRGEEETRRQIILYSVLLVALTLVLSPFGLMGPVYFVAALLLGGLFIHNAIRLWREATPRSARRLYLYSILYLFALFTAMAVDRVVTN
jgi:heme o synthase